MMAIRAVLFDLDNTLTHRDLTVEAYAQYLIKCYQSSLQDIDLAKILALIHQIDCGGYPQKEHLTHPSIAASVAHALLQQLTWIQPPSLAELTQFWFENFARCAVAMPGAAELLEKLKPHYILAVVSNGGHQSRLQILQGLGFLDYFVEVISSERAGSLKPNADIFLYSCAQLGLTAEQCLFVGDHPINDIQGAQQVGMQALYLEGFHQSDIVLDVPHLQHLSQILDYLD